MTLLVAKLTCAHCHGPIRPEDSWVEVAPGVVYCKLSCEAEANAEKRGNRICPNCRLEFEKSDQCICPRCQREIVE